MAAKLKVLVGYGAMLACAGVGCASPRSLADGRPAAASSVGRRSLPQPLPLPEAAEAPRDVPFPGVIDLAVDATDLQRRILAVRETIPVARAGPMTLLYPKWLPGNHSPTGTIRQMAGLEVFADGVRIEWTRDPVEMFAFHIDVPRGATMIEVRMQAITPQSGDVVMSSEMMILDWNSVLLYPAGHFARDIALRASVKLPVGWKSATALDGGVRAGDVISFAPASLETVVDSPVLAGRHFRSIELSRAPVPVRLNIVADDEKFLAVPDAQIRSMRALIPQAYALFGAHHYDHYDALFWLSQEMVGKGLEHSRSSEDGADPALFTDPAGHIWFTDLLPHEFTHSWNGKYRRPADLWTPGFEVPMRNSLLWVYEGQTQYWGQVLAARSGMATRQNALDQLAYTAAVVDAQSGRAWRSLADTTNVPIFNYRASPQWADWQRGADYYIEGQLIWLDVDTLIRERTGRRKSLDDFARAFFGGPSDAGETKTYGFDDVVAGLNGVLVYDWASFLRARIVGHGPGAPLDGLKRAGYDLVYRETATELFKAIEARDKVSDLSFSIGLTIAAAGRIRSVVWQGVADRAGLVPGNAILAVNGGAFTPDRLTTAITLARTTGTISLTVRVGEEIVPVDLRYRAGLRYPSLERIVDAPDLLAAIYAPRAVGRRSH